MQTTNLDGITTYALYLYLIDLTIHYIFNFSAIMDTTGRILFSRLLAAYYNTIRLDRPTVIDVWCSFTIDQRVAVKQHLGVKTGQEVFAAVTANKPLV